MKLLRVATLLTVFCGYAVPNLPGMAEQSVREALQSKQGRELAQLWCRQCHLTDPEGTGYVQSGVPTFAEIANRPEQTLEKTKLFLANPHPPMPNLNLSRDEIDNLATYILSLRQANSN